MKVYKLWDDFAKRVHQNKAFLGMVASQHSCVYVHFVKGILVVNVLVFLLWRIPPLHHFMMRYFLSSSTKKGNEVVFLSVHA